MKAQSRLVSVIYKFRLSRKSLSQHEVRSRMSFKGSGWCLQLGSPLIPYTCREAKPSRALNDPASNFQTREKRHRGFARVTNISLLRQPMLPLKKPLRLICTTFIQHKIVIFHYEVIAIAFSPNPQSPMHQHQSGSLHFSLSNIASCRKFPPKPLGSLYDYFHLVSPIY